MPGTARAVSDTIPAFMGHIQSRDLFASVVGEGEERKYLQVDFQTNVELAYFAQSRILDGDWRPEAERLRAVFGAKGLECSLHGPFYEMHYQSKDSQIREVVRRRFLQILDVAACLQARSIVIHSTYSPLSGQPDNAEKWIKASLEFLLPMAELAGKLGVVFMLENIHDDRPEPVKELLRRAASPSLKACIDMGHWFLFSKLPIRHWIDVYGEDLGYFHLHDNGGVYDEHDAVGRGRIPYPELFKALETSSARPKYCIEVQTVDRIAPSMDHLRKEGWLA